MIENDANAELVRRHLAAENAHDLEGTLATLAPDCVFRDHATGQTWLGRDGAAEHYLHWWRTFDVEVVRGKNQIAFWRSNDLYVAQATWRGRHIGEYLGIPSTGRLITLPFVVFVTMQDGLMAGEEFFYDLNSLVAQIDNPRIPELGLLSYRCASAGVQVGRGITG